MGLLKMMPVTDGFWALAILGMTLSVKCWHTAHLNSSVYPPNQHRQFFSLKPSTYGKEILERFISDKMPPAVSGWVAWCKTIRLVVIRIAVNSLFILSS